MEPLVTHLGQNDFVHTSSRETARGGRCQHASERNDFHVCSPAGSVADPNLTPPPAGGGVNLPILEACTVIGVIAEIGVTVVVIARGVTVRTAAEEPAE